MTHVSLYRRFRPLTWDKVIGQEHIVTTLVNQINSGAISHAYLFTGTRGTGKTSTAKIFARAVNCIAPQNGSPCGVCAHCVALASPANLDVIEMDGASNNSVDNIRELIENTQYPAAEVKYKVYIIDEVHMLSGSAFNALLKTLEEPPKHVIFILATTEVPKLPQTILSRCLRFDFRLVSKDKLVALLAEVFDDISYTYEAEALEILALHGEGSVRDTLSIADMCMSYSPKALTAEAVLEVLGASDFNTLYSIAEGVLQGNTGTVLAATNMVYAKGKGITTLNKDLGAFFRDLISIKNVPNYRATYNNAQYEQLKKLSNSCDNFRLGRAMDIMASVESLIRYSTQPQIMLDACLIKAAELQTEPSIEGLVSRIRALETRLKEIEQSGIKISSQPPIPAKKDNTSLPSVEETLAAFAAKVEEAPVFEDAQEDAQPEPDSQSKAVMSSLLTAVRVQGLNMLYRALASQEDYYMQDKTLIINVSDAASWTMFIPNNNLELFKKLVKDDFGGDYSVDIVRKSNKTEQKQENRNTLTELFGDKLQDKNRQ